MLPLLLIIIFFIIFFIIFSYILYKIFKSILKTIISITFIIIILTAFIGFFVYKDIQNIQENKNSPITILLQDQEYIAGVIMEKGEIRFIPEETIKEYDKKDLKEIIGSNFKIITISMKFIEEMPLEAMHLDQFNKDLTKQELISTLRSEKPMDRLLIDIFNLQPEMANVAKNTVFSSDIRDNSQFKAALTLLTLQNLIKEEETEYLLNSYKDNNIQVYKETITFKLFKLIPNSLLLSEIEKSQA